MLVTVIVSLGTFITRRSAGTLMLRIDKFSTAFACRKMFSDGFQSPVQAIEFSLL